jgi:hypothetical protein
VEHFYRFREWRARVFRDLFPSYYLSTLSPQIAARFPQLYLVIHGITNSLSTGPRARAAGGITGHAVGAGAGDGPGLICNLWLHYLA